LRLWKGRWENGTIEVEDRLQTPPQRAFIGVHPCDLAAIAVQDQVFMGGPFVDPHYAARREHTFIVVVNCTEAGGTCFCSSMGTGPRAAAGYDVAMTEVLAGEEHYFIVTAGSESGAQLLADLSPAPATDEEVQKADAGVAEAEHHMGRTLDTADIKNLLYRNLEHPRWDDVADRCLTCTNCTMVCPTCFCTTVEESTDLGGDHMERWRSWDSCFTMDFSYIHGGSVRTSTRARYRQWMTHKLATWIDQFGTSGCIGCGRCITWCPVGIDITEEVKAIRDTEPARAAAERKEV